MDQLIKQLDKEINGMESMQADIAAKLDNARRARDLLMRSKSGNNKVRTKRGPYSKKAAAKVLELLQHQKMTRNQLAEAGKIHPSSMSHAVVELIKEKKIVETDQKIGKAKLLELVETVERPEVPPYPSEQTTEREPVH